VIEGDVNFHKSIENTNRGQESSQVKTQDLRSFRSSIKDILSLQQEISATMWENNELLNQFDQLTAPLRDLDDDR